ncbi:phage tail tape measure protein [Flavilitoribacter nigricans]|uniref:Phage tail tape measure protein n=1 Tax=Flavilitoribacter nigricans (strain ATCC 23147 / DSM 23189 / NBRC 102662 / NCIMB 1420 / SS-2) TaxID=1122177 RepID=A0A2D0MWL8_FLAN2|nr:phage tail tape measure protein [Flavilitoribacter nigricans]PHN00580.1 phage tail tape measure protein [Flavilitoribacter nigricans DSM 23189 = NBRC 102662]
MDNRSLTILDVKDFLGQALNSNLKLFDKLSGKSSEFDKRVNGTFSDMNINLREVGRNLLTVGSIAGGAVATGLFKAANNAKEFKHEFLELENLNLDKTEAQIDKLERNVLDAAFATGRAGTEMSKAFFDIQSGTGMFGNEVDAIARKTSDFSRAFKVDFNTALEGGVKGIRNFNLEADQMDDFFASAVKTVQVGIVTFEQLARVQTDYAGAANTAGQSVDSANKLFAVFTAKAKSAEEAATLTKSAFTDLLRPETLKSFEKIGVQVFDKQTGKVRQLDEIVSQLNDRFAKLRGNDRAVTNLVNEFKGSEGLIALIGEAAKNGDNMLETFRAFDGTEFGLEKALANAKEDTTQLADIVQNKVNVLFTRLGMELLPHINRGLDYVISNWLPEVERRLPGIIQNFGQVADAVGKGVKEGSKIGQTLGRWGENALEFYESTNPFMISSARRDLRDMGMTRDQVRSLSDTEAVQIRRAANRGLMDEAGQVNVERAQNLIDKLADSTSEGAKDFVRVLQSEISRVNLAGELDADIEKIQNNINSLGGPASDLPSLPTGSSRSTSGSTSAGRAAIAEGLRGVVGGKEQQRNVTVTIQKMVGVETLSTTNLSNSVREIEQIFEEMLIRAVRDTEVAIANG